MKKQQENGEGQTPKENSERTGQSFGTWLRQQRVVREIELREIAETSKISMRYLRALEDDRFDILPATVFAKGFLRQYAKYVGLDPEEVVNFFITALEDNALEEQPIHPRRKSRATSFWTYLGIFFLLAAILLGIVWLVGHFDRNSEAAPQQQNSTSSTATPAAVSVPAPATAKPSPTGLAAEPGASEPSPVAPQPASQSDSSPSEESPLESNSEPATQAATPQAATPQADTLQSESAPTGSSQNRSSQNRSSQNTAPLSVTLDFSGECWVEALSDGRSRLAEMRVQGESLQLVAEREIQLKLGNIDAVEIEVNGRPYQVESVAGTSVRTITLDLETVRALETGGVQP